ncbi:ABC transporter permease [Rhodohalobacter barkolensis]|uniref:ABC transporter permease n=1 Tax=Rhodohalobacter barkolensis TaxID=2053187 RepID=A0A2N0VEV1_9BACT|nr:ABC transporter permease subunit [Rhodohalobacter barkolensis]PKD42719.1 ABC transporter permease [Rhodohalobacter barkolensis]
MSLLMHIIQNEWKSLLRGKWVIGYGLIFLVLTDTLLRFGGGGAETLLSLSNVMLLFVPLVGMIYGILYIYQSREFVELLLTQPINRGVLYWGLFLGISTPLMAAFIIGSMLPLGWHGILMIDGMASAMVLALGGILTLIFASLGFVFGLMFYEDKIKGFGFTIVVWLFLAILYDGLVLMLVFLFGDYPLENFVIAVSMLNPIDLARIMVMLEFDVSALMGYTGAVFNRFFGTAMGISVASAMLLVWLAVPSWIGLNVFRKKDF